MKRKKAKELLAESFRELAKKKDIDKITVQDIVENCDYSTATFYRHYNDKYDLIAWVYTQKAAQIMGQIDGEHYHWEHTLLDAAKYFEADRDYLANLMLHTSGQDSFFQYMSDINTEALTKQILSANDLDKLNQETEMYVRLYCMGTVSLTCEWLLGKYNVTPEELAAIYRNSLPQPLEQYLIAK